MKETDIAYLAGIVDGEGYIGIKKSKAYRCAERTTPSYIARIQIRMVDEPAIRFLSETLGGWYYKEKPHLAKGRPLYCFQASDQKARAILETLLPYLRVKATQARTVLELCALKSESRQHRTKVVGTREFPNKYGTVRTVKNKCLSDEYVARCHSLYERCKLLNKVGIAA